MHQQVANRDRVFASTAECRQVVRHALVEPQFPAIDEDHRGGGRRNDFRQRRQVVHRSLGVDPRARLPVEAAISSFPDDGAMSPDNHGSAGEATRTDAAAHDLVDAGESFSGHAHGFGDDVRQARDAARGRVAPVRDGARVGRSYG